MRQPKTISCHYFADVNFIEENKCVVLLMKKKTSDREAKPKNTSQKYTTKNIKYAWIYIYTYVYRIYSTFKYIDIHQMYAFLWLSVFSFGRIRILCRFFVVNVIF